MTLNLFLGIGCVFLVNALQGLWVLILSLFITMVLTTYSGTRDLFSRPGAIVCPDTLAILVFFVLNNSVSNTISYHLNSITG